MNIGDSYEEKILISQDVVKNFGVFSGDFNPIHFDDAAAKEQGFKSKIAHGMVSASFFSKIFATQFPGPGTVYLGQNLKFVAPVYIDELLTYKLTVTEKKPDKPIYTIHTEASNQTGELKVVGDAVIRFSSPKK